MTTNKETYTEQEVQDIVTFYVRKSMIDTANNCAIFCDEMKGYLFVGDDIRKHYGIEAPIVTNNTIKSNLRRVK